MNRMRFLIGRKPITPRRIFLGNTGLRNFKFFDFFGLQINADAERSEGNTRKSFRQCGTEFTFRGDGFCLCFRNFSALTDNEPNVLSDDFGRRHFVLNGLFLGLFLRLRGFLDRSGIAKVVRTIG